RGRHQAERQSLLADSKASARQQPPLAERDRLLRRQHRRAPAEVSRNRRPLPHHSRAPKQPGWFAAQGPAGRSGRRWSSRKRASRQTARPVPRSAIACHGACPLSSNRIPLPAGLAIRLSLSLAKKQTALRQPCTAGLSGPNRSSNLRGNAAAVTLSTQSRLSRIVSRRILRVIAVQTRTFTYSPGASPKTAVLAPGRRAGTRLSPSRSIQACQCGHQEPRCSVALSSQSSKAPAGLPPVQC